MKKSLKKLLLSACLLFVFSFGCASMSTIDRAEIAFESAKKARADIKAPFQFYAAEEYLQLAKQEGGRMSFDRAEKFAGESIKFSELAIVTARERY